MCLSNLFRVLEDPSWFYRYGKTIKAETLSFYNAHFFTVASFYTFITSNWNFGSSGWLLKGSLTPHVFALL